MARYFPSNGRMAVGVTDFIQDRDYDRLSFEIEKQNALTNGQMAYSTADQIMAASDAERMMEMAKNKAAHQSNMTDSRINQGWTNLAFDAAGSALGFVDFGGNSGLAPDPVGSQGNPDFSGLGLGAGEYPGGPAVGGGRIPLAG